MSPCPAMPSGGQWGVRGLKSMFALCVYDCVYARMHVLVFMSTTYRLYIGQNGWSGTVGIAIVCTLANWRVVNRQTCSYAHKRGKHENNS